MAIIKRIIKWIVDFFRRLFGKKKKKVLKKSNTPLKESTKNKLSNSYSSDTLPSYMMISNEDKVLLMNNIQSIKKKLKYSGIKQREIAKIIALLSNASIDLNSIEEYLNKQDLERIKVTKINELLSECDEATINGVYKIIDEYKNDVRLVRETIDNLDSLSDYINNHDISFETNELINDQLLPFNNENFSDSKVYVDKDIINTIKSWDKSILDKVKLEYQTTNYVTISNIMIDNIITKYRKIEDDYKHHRFNKSYYERELNKIKEQINYLKRIKNTSVVYQEIEILKKELYTKSKDKYDILYNNEVFIDINKKCDELLDKVNQKVIDIKKEEKVKEDVKEKKKDEYLEKILLRFKDLNLSRELILLHKEKESDMLDYANISQYLDMVYLEFIEGVSNDFNYQRNKTKTELVKLYNDLNNILSYKKKEKHLPIEHINFRMEDLVDAVKVKKMEVEKEIDYSKELTNSELVDDKINKIEEKFIGIKHEKVLKKTD